MRPPGGSRRSSGPAATVVAGAALWAGLLAGGLALWGGAVAASPSDAVAGVFSPVAAHHGGEAGEPCGETDRAYPRRWHGRDDPSPDACDPADREPVRMRPAEGETPEDAPSPGTSEDADAGSGGGATAAGAGPGVGWSAPSTSPDATPAPDGRADLPPRASRRPAGQPPGAASSTLTEDRPAAEEEEEFTQVAASTSAGRVGLLGVIATVCVVAVSAGAVRTILGQRADRTESR